jgi:hypothetical protein
MIPKCPLPIHLDTEKLAEGQIPIAKSATCNKNPGMRETGFKPEKPLSSPVLFCCMTIDDVTEMKVPYRWLAAISRRRTWC